MPVQGSTDVAVPAADRLTDDGIRTTLYKLSGHFRHDAGTTITGASPITDPRPAGLGNEFTRVVTGSPARPSQGPSTREGGRPASLSGGMSFPPVDRPSPGSVPARGPLIVPEGCHVSVAAFLAAWPPEEITPSWLDPTSRGTARCTVPSSFRPVRRIGAAGSSEEGGVIASLVIALVVIGLSGAAHEAVVLGRAGWHAAAGWFGAHPSAVAGGGGG